MILEKEIERSQYLNEEEKRFFITIINESLSINNAVVDETNNIYGIFLENIQNLKWEKIEGGKAAKAELSFSYKPFNVDFDTEFNFICYNVYDANLYSIFKTSYSFGNGGTRGTIKISINVGFLNGKLKESPKPTLQHELEHLYQRVKINGNLIIKGFGETNRDAYEWARLLLTNGINTITNQKYTNEEFDVAFLVYTHANYEIDAFVNQLYQDLKVSFKHDSDPKVIKNSSAYKYYITGKEYLEAIKSNPKIYKPIIEPLGIKYKDFVSLFTTLNNRFIRKIGKALAKYETYLMENTTVISPILKTRHDIL